MLACLPLIIVLRPDIFEKKQIFWFWEIKINVLSNKKNLFVMQKVYSVFVIFLLSITCNLAMAQTGPTDDFDGDGVINQLDLDDDHDGVPDAMEVPSCFFTSAEAAGIVSVTSQYTSPDAFTLLYDGNTTTTTFNFSNGSLTVGGNIFTIELPTAVPLSQVLVTHNITTTAAARARLYGSNDNTNFTDLSGTNIAINGTPITFTVNQNAGNYKYYRIQCEVTGALATGNTIAEIVVTVASSYNPSAYPKTTCANNFAFNLDSDGDGCSDAFEGGATENLSPNYQFPIANSGANGLPDAVETAPESGLINYTSSYNTYANNSSSIYCNTFVSMSGNVFMDFDGSSTQSTPVKEPGVKSVLVRAFKPDGNFVDATTDSNGHYEFLGAQLTAGVPLRIEFRNLPAGFHDGFVGGGSNTTVQFVTSSVGNSQANLALSLPSHYSSTIDPYMAVVTFRRNNETTTNPTIWFLDTNKTRNFIPNSTSDANKEWSTPDNSTAATYPIPTRYVAATKAQIQNTLTLAWDRYNNRLFTGAYYRGWTSMGTNASANGFGEGIIYAIPINGTTSSTPTPWLDLETLLGDNIAGTYVADGNHAGNGAFGKTSNNANKVGYTGLGCMKVSADGTQLYVVNLNTLEVLVIPIGPGGTAPTLASQIKRFPLPTAEAPGSWPDGRPHRAVLGLGVHPVTGKVFATLTCTGPTLADMKGVIYSFDPNDSSPDSSDFVKELEIPLNIVRPATNPNVNPWYAQTNHVWETVTTNAVFYTNTSSNAQHNQMWLGEIAFDALSDGSFAMSVAERNRYHDMLDGSWYVTGGVIYRAVHNGTTWSLENNGVAGPLTSIVNWTFNTSTKAGFNTSPTNRFYKGVGREGTFGMGMVAHVPGSEEVFMSTLDNVFNSGTSGIAWLNKTNGDRTRDNRLLADFTANGYNTMSFNKSNSWGDIEALTDLPPLEIGNRVWLDTNQDGIQDPNEPGIGGIQLQLCLGSTIVGSTITDANGNYYFTEANVNLNAATGLLPNTNYEIKIPNGQPGLSTYTLTAPNADATAGGDVRDSDGTPNGSGEAHIMVTTGGYGQNDHTFDFGFHPAPPAIPACLGNYVWIDDNLDGIQDPIEVGVAGITVTLYNSLGSVVSSTVTDAYGYYKFCPLDPGTYQLGFTLPANYVFSSANTTADSLDSDVNPATGTTGMYTLASGDSNWTIDAGIHFQRPTTATVGNYVWYDTNQNGTQDSGEEGISNVVVTLYSPPTNPIKSTITDANGFYLFTDVPPATYCVGFTPLVGLVLSPNNGAVTDPQNSDANQTTGKSAPFVVNPGDEIPTIDAGMYSQASTIGGLGDKVWYDMNQNGLQDGDENGVEGVTVTLYDGLGTTVLATTTTNALGNYIFNNLSANNYIVGFSNLPSGYVFTTNTASNPILNSDADLGTGKTNTITLGSGEFNMNIDAGIYPTDNTLNNSIGNYVWYDTNKDGIQDGTEIGVPGVNVHLYNASQTVLAHTTTDGAGHYLFPNLPNGTYSVGFSNIPLGYVLTNPNTTSDVLDSDADQATGLTASVTLSGNTHDRSLDAGIHTGDITLGKATLGDKVWYDMNNDGIQDPTELGVPSVTATLYGSDGITPLKTTQTDALGNYIFTGLDAGQYCVGFTSLPSGFTISPKNADAQNIDGEVNSDVNAGTQKTDLVNLGAGEDKMSVDMGIAPAAGLASLGNYVWFDLNQDGLQNTGEPGVPGVTVTLYDASNAVLKTTTTNGQGNYVFAGLTPATYSVGFSNLPEGYVFTLLNSDALGLNGAVNSDADPINGLTTTVSLSAGEHNPNLDAGITSQIIASVGDYVWFDENQNGIQESTELPIGGVLLTLLNASQIPVASTITKPDGSYIFTNVTPGTYTIKFSQTPSGLEFTDQESNPLSNTGSNANPISGLTPSFTVTPGSHNPTIDAGLTVLALAGCGNYVWYDVNQDGLQDPSEVGVPGILVTLYGADGTTVVATTTTDGNGAYTFTQLTPGNYEIGFSNIPAQYNHSPYTGVLNDALNSDLQPNGRTVQFSLTEGEYNANIDAGISPNVPLASDLISFQVQPIGCATLLTWTAASTSSTKEYAVIRKSLSSNQTETIVTLPATVGSSGTQSYSYFDTKIEQGDWQYRLKMLDQNGGYSFSNTRGIQMNCTQQPTIQVYPNPASDNLSVLIPVEGESEVRLVLSDMAGRIIQQSTTAIDDLTVIQLPIASLRNGIYQLKVTVNNESTLFRILKN
jgi:protocatechuate 3,4-dioxygenase beta subunit